MEEGHFYQHDIQGELATNEPDAQASYLIFRAATWSQHVSGYGETKRRLSFEFQILASLTDRILLIPKI